MKTRLLLTALVLSFTLLSCDDHNSNPHNAAVESAFWAKYPGATHVDWEIENSYYTVDFRHNKLDVTAWFTSDGQWILTETDIRFEQLPDAIKASFAQSEYALWRIDDVDMLERKDMETVYIIDVEQYNQEQNLFYSVDGILVKFSSLDNNGNINGTGNNPIGANPISKLPSSLPENITAYISTNHPNARIIEIEPERNGGYEIDIIENAAHKELRFSSTGDWLYTQTENIARSNVPQNILTALQNSEYASYRIDEIDYYETPTTYKTEKQHNK